MKKFFLLTLGLSLILGGCATNDSGTASSDKPKAAKQEDKLPSVGMTKEEVIAMYGKTDNKQISSEGETWIYNLNMGEAFIPFNFGYRPKMRIINFDADGKVKSWSYSK